MGGGGDLGVATDRRINKFACCRTQILFKKSAEGHRINICRGRGDLKKMYVEVRRLTLLCRRRNLKNQKSFFSVLPNIRLFSLK